MTHAPGRRYRLPIVPDEQVAKSRGCLGAAASVPAGAAIVLGAGRCSEIPLAELARRFQPLVINDIEPLPSLELVRQAGLSAAEAATIEWSVADLTGMTRPLQQAWQRILAHQADAAAAASAMLNAVKTTVAEPLSLEIAASQTMASGAAPPERKFDLVVASCILSQLHNVSVKLACDCSASDFRIRPTGSQTPSQRPPRFTHWRSPMEARFIDWLTRITAPGGRIFLSESVQMCFVEPDDPGHWSTEGTLRMTHTTNLADYVDGRFTIEQSDRWNWVADPPRQAGQRGRLFDVQGLVLGLR